MGWFRQYLSEALGGRKLPDDKWEAHLHEMAGWAKLDPSKGKDDDEKAQLAAQKQTGVDMAALEKTYKARLLALRSAAEKGIAAARKQVADYELAPDEGKKRIEEVEDLYLDQALQVTKHVRDIVDPRWHRRAWEAVSSKTGKRVVAAGAVAKQASDVGLKSAVAAGAVKGTVVVTLLGGAVTPIAWVALAVGILDKLAGGLYGLYKKGQKELDYKYQGPLERLVKGGWKSARAKSQEWKKMDAKKSLPDRQQWEKTLYRVIKETQEEQEEYCGRANDFEKDAHDALRKADDARMKTHADLTAIEKRWADEGYLRAAGTDQYKKYIADRRKVVASLGKMEKAVADVVDLVTKINEKVNTTVKETSDQVVDLRKELAESQKYVTVG